MLKIYLSVILNPNPEKIIKKAKIMGVIKTNPLA
jgi:hypothetical protein